MNKKIPSGLLVLSAAIVVGIFGSQLGGLSGQAAGGDSAGCGGDAYYDEDLGRMVEAGSAAGDGDESANPSEPTERITVNFEPVQAGASVPGNDMVRLLSPNESAAAELLDLGDDKLRFKPKADISSDGRFAVIGWGVNRPGHEDLSHIQLFERRNEQWWLINELFFSRGRATPVMQIMLVAVSEEDRVFLAVDSMAINYHVTTSTWEFTTVEYQLAQLEEQLGSDEEEMVGNLSLNGAVNSLLTSPQTTWTHGLIEHLFDDPFFRAKTSMTNQVVITTDSGASVFVDSCAYGDEPTLGEDGTLYCEACTTDSCHNPLNTENVLGLDIDERRDMRLSLRQRTVQWNEQRAEIQRQELMQNPPSVLNGDLEAYRSEKSWGSSTATSLELWEVSQAFYGNSLPDGWTEYATCQHNGSEAKFVYKPGVLVIAFAGTPSPEAAYDLVDYDRINRLQVYPDPRHPFFPPAYKAVEDLSGWCIEWYRAFLRSHGFEIDYIVGHGLGGAAASIHSWKYGQARLGIVTFGAPHAVLTSAHGSYPMLKGERFFAQEDPISSLWLWHGAPLARFTSNVEKSTTWSPYPNPDNPSTFRWARNHPPHFVTSRSYYYNSWTFVRQAREHFFYGSFLSRW